MKVFIFITMVLASLFSRAQPILDKLIDNQEPKALLAFQKNVDRFFASDWVFKSLTAAEIDHFKKGYVLAWRKQVNGLLIDRQYVFSSDSKLAYVYEQRFLHDTLFSQGPVFFKGDTVTHIIQVVPQKKSLRLKEGKYWDYKVDFYTYEIFRTGTLSCIYKTKSRNHYEMLFDKRRDKIELLSGDDCLAILK
jgi:hypothetical protein